MSALKFTIYHGFAASLALHSLLGLPLVLQALASPPENPPTLVVELQGVVAENQAEQKVEADTRGEAKRDAADMAKPAEAAAPSEQPADVAEDDKEGSAKPPPTPPTPPTPAAPAQTPSPPTEIKSGSPGSHDISGAEERQNAQTIKTDRENEVQRIKAYVKLLTKKVQANLVYPDEGRQAGLHGAATVSFVILPSGQIRPETLKIVESSGQPKLDASALKTVRSSAPFDPPPKEMTVTIAVAFGRKH